VRSAAAAASELRAGAVTARVFSIRARHAAWLGASLLIAAPALAAPPPPRPWGDGAAPPVVAAPAPQADAAQPADETEPPPGQPAPDAPFAALRGLDKASGVATEFTAPLGEAVDFGRLTIRVEACEADGEDGDMAWLVITDAKSPDAPAFEGWMFAESPALSALDHPRYDVWLAQCSTVSGGAL
jgi:hypothetical protein